MKIGRQEPTYSVVGSYASSDGSLIAEMFEEDGGATFYDSQRMELELMLARNADGSPAAQTIGISKPRQNGKSYAARYYAAYMGDFEHRDVLYSAHHSKTTHAMFKALCDLFESPERFPDFAKDVKNISRAKGFEGIYFNDWKDADGNMHKGGCIEFSTRTNSGARGGTYSVIIIDEAQELTRDEQEAMLPTVSAASDIKDKRKLPQQIFVGTPPAPSCHGTVFADMHKRAHSDDKGAGWWLEWSVEGSIARFNSAELALSAAYETNPAMGYRIAEKTIVNEYENMSLDGFARERLGWWSPVIEEKAEYVIDAEAWKACMSNEQKPEGKTAYGVKFSLDGSEVALCGAVCPKDGPARISLINRQPMSSGIQWLADWLNARYDKACCVVIDGRNGVSTLVEKITPTWRYKGSVICPRAGDVIASVGTLTNEVSERTVTWFAGQEQLTESATTSTKRAIGGGFGFGGENSAPIEAAALALWGCRTSKRDPSRKMRIG